MYGIMINFGSSVSKIGHFKIYTKKGQIMSVWLDDMESHQGSVLYLCERMGNSYAIVWDGTKVRQTMYGAPMGNLLPDQRTMVDCTPEVLSMAERWLAEHILTKLIHQAEKDSNTPFPDKKVRWANNEGVVKKRTLDPDRTFHFDPFNTTTKYRLLVRTMDNRRVFVKEEKVEVIDPDFVNFHELEEKAYELSKEHNWYAVMICS